MATFIAEQIRRIGAYFKSTAHVEIQMLSNERYIMLLQNAILETTLLCKGCCYIEYYAPQHLICR